ncbi:MAG TPA: ATP-binding protein [Rhizomicrobium sp.]|jgi:SpoVK/Ycf46/Vps4 family AAA+-type ATPase
MSKDAEYDKVKRHLSPFADIMLPEECEEPILAPAVRAALFEWMSELRLKKELKAAGLKARHLALLYGPPGCGKTTFAHHFAARLGFPLACVRSESLIAAYLGATGQNIDKLFRAMDETEGKVVMFFDEVDAIGGRRMNDQGASVERANSLNVLLRRIEQFEGIGLAATNRHDFLDPALWRRFDMQIPIDLPGDEERFAIIKRYAAPFDLPDEDVDLLTELTAGASPALLRGLMEGVKRSLVLGPKVGRSVDSVVAVYAAVTASVTPPPEYETKVPLWSGGVEKLAGLTWPMGRSDAA